MKVINKTGYIFSTKAILLLHSHGYDGRENTLIKLSNESGSRSTFKCISSQICKHLDCFLKWNNIMTSKRLSSDAWILSDW